MTVLQNSGHRELQTYGHDESSSLGFYGTNHIPAPRVEPSTTADSEVTPTNELDREFWLRWQLRPGGRISRS